MIRNAIKTFMGVLWVTSPLLAQPVGQPASQPADKDLIPEARKVLEYLQGIRGKGIPTGVSGYGGGPAAVLHRTGREPSIWADDVAGHHTKGGELYHGVLRTRVAEAKKWWLEKGGIVSLHYHWMKPGDPDGTAWLNRPKGAKPLDLEKAVTPGTEENRTVREDLGMTADYLAQLNEARVPVLWRPLHEIDGGWFWWTDPKKPENTAAFYRLVFDYLVKERKIHNLIWVYNAAHVTHAFKKENASLEDHAAWRRRFYPGDEYVDIVSIDPYPNPTLGWNQPWDDDRAKALELMGMVAPGKILAIAEDSALLNPDVAQKNQTPWAYDLTWWGDSSRPGWTKQTYNHPYMITLDELPAFTDRNIAPNVRITEPAEGTEVEGPEVKLAGMATDRNGNLKTVTLYAVKGAWRNWTERSDEAVSKAFADKAKLGEAAVEANGRWTFTWKNADAGYQEIVALARDAEGAVGNSNVLRLTVGLRDLARGRAVTTSSASKWGNGPQAAVDDDLYTAWWADREQKDPQWLRVDLGEVRRVGGVSVLWSKAYAKEYGVEVSKNGETWQEVARVKGRRINQGDSDLFRLAPTEARYVRLMMYQAAAAWQSYVIYKLGVYEGIPE